MTAQYESERVSFSSDILEFLSHRRASTHAAFFIGYLKPGMTLLDAGCGPGSITVDLAKIVAPGRVIGIDIDPKHIELAQKKIAEAKVPNVVCQVGDINALDFSDESFDAAFSHGVIEYLSDPVHVFKELYRVLKKGGVLGVRHADWGGFLLAARSDYVRKGFSLFTQMMEENGGDPYFGRKQASYTRKAGFTNMTVSASYDCWTSTPENARRNLDFMAGYCQSPEFRDPVVEHGLSSQEDLDKIIAAFQEWRNDPDAFAAEAWAEAVAWKE